MVVLRGHQQVAQQLTQKHTTIFPCSYLIGQAMKIREMGVNRNHTTHTPETLRLSIQLSSGKEEMMGLI